MYFFSLLCIAMKHGNNKNTAPSGAVAVSLKLPKPIHARLVALKKAQRVPLNTSANMALRAGLPAVERALDQMLNPEAV